MSLPKATKRSTGAALIAMLSCLTMLSGHAGAERNSVKQPPERPRAVRVEVELPSVSTGVAGGTLALAVYAPETAEGARYPDGAPVVIGVAGGTQAGSLAPVAPVATDMVRISFLLPGGTDARSGRRSDGEYDYRGASSIAALRDVLLYAAGELVDESGRTLDEAVPPQLRSSNVGLIGLSNGGNLATAAAAVHGAELAGRLAYIVQWESPVSSQIATLDLGPLQLRCPGGQTQRLNVSNPRYELYGPRVLVVDYGDLAYDSAVPDRLVLHDGNGDGAYTTIEDPVTGCRTPDLDLDGELSVEEDWPLSAFSDGVVEVYSRPVTQALEEAGVFGSGWPRGIASVAQAGDFWDRREAVAHYRSAVARIPELEGMVLASVKDHVQTAPGHPHIRQAFEGWDSAGAWVRINPGATYMAQADPRLALRPDLPNNRPSTPPQDWMDEEAYCVPEDIGDGLTHAAALWQMADRAEVRLPSETPAATGTVEPGLTATPTPEPEGTPSATASGTTAPGAMVGKAFLPAVGKQ